MATSTAALPLAVDPTTRRLILLLPAALLAHDLGELAGNDQLNRAAHDLTRRFPIPAERALPTSPPAGPRPPSPSAPSLPA
jgi:hypothetical protein